MPALWFDKPGPCPLAPDTLARGGLWIAPLADARHPLAEEVKALERARKKGTLKALITP
ncbi:MAG TPA: hypothetical protein QF533_08880 [Nitrospinota bacterium]|nr:hypothetical protein [Nitrospinota bacterium]MDP7664118.1 hypothetical protein [Nitrospinota bacterium]HJP14436.1 hypothetical protein [Nitrospinota bacterium]